MTAMAADQRHVVARAVAHLHADLDQLAHPPVWTMGPAEAGETLTELTRLAARVAELELRVAAHADRVGVGDATGATSTGSWWAERTRLTRVEAHRRSGLASALDGRCERVREALAAGAMVVEQAQVIVRALDDLPADVEPAIVAQAERVLVGYAADHDAKTLRILGRRILDIVSPEVAEAHEARLLAQEDRAAEAAMRFTMSEDGHGSVRGRFTLPRLHGQMLRKALLALAAPKHLSATTGRQGGAEGRAETGERVPLPERLGRAFAEYVERYPTEDLPKAGGVAATVVVTMTLDQLQDGLAHGPGAAMVDTGEVVSAATARRLACEAGIIPVVLGGRSQVLDLGRRRRLHTEPQRIAMGLRDGGCTADGCDWPPGLCHAHHDTPWSHGGRTSVERGRLLCPHHHARAHDPSYTVTHLTGGRVAFHRRT